MIFAEQVSKFRKDNNMTQETLAEQCDVSRQAVAKWESGESIPGIYKIVQISRVFDVSLDELVLGNKLVENNKDVAKKIYILFTQNMESLRTCLLAGKCSSDNELATRLRSEIKQSRLCFTKKLVDELLGLTNDFGIYTGTVISKKEYEDVFGDEKLDTFRKRTYCDTIIPSKYEKIEELLGEYLELS